MGESVSGRKRNERAGMVWREEGVLGVHCVSRGANTEEASQHDESFDFNEKVLVRTDDFDRPVPRATRKQLLLEVAPVDTHHLARVLVPVAYGGVLDTHDRRPISLRRVINGRGPEKLSG